MVAQGDSTAMRVVLGHPQALLEGDYVMTDEQRAGKVRALLEERRGAEMRGDEGHMSEIDAQLRYYGHQAAKPVDRSEKRPSQVQAEAEQR